MKTDNPIALRTLMSETIFATADAVASPQKADISVPPSPEGGAMEEGHAGGRNAMTLPSGDGGTSGNARTETFVYQGDRSSGILFVLRDTNHPYFSPPAEEAFAKTLSALQLTPQTVALVNLANADNPNDFGKLMDFFEPKKIALLGVDPASLKLPAIPQNTCKKGKKATVFHTFGFAEMLADPGKKKAFWLEFKAFMTS